MKLTIYLLQKENNWFHYCISFSLKHALEIVFIYPSVILLLNIANSEMGGKPAEGITVKYR